MRRGQTRPNDIAVAQRRQAALELRKSGATYTQILDAMRTNYGAERLPKSYDERHVHEDVTHELLKLRKVTALDAMEVVQLELERLNALFLAVWPRSRMGDVQAIDRALKIMVRMAELQGVITPLVIDWRMEVLALLQAGTVTAAMVTEELGIDLARELFESVGIQTNPGSEA